MNDRPGNDRRTILAIAAVVFVVASLTHEGIGHGGACLVTGGKLLGLASSFCDCDKAGLTVGSVRLVKAAGTLANLGLGAVAVLVLRGRAWPPATRYALWMLGTVNLLHGGGYLLVDPLAGFGDWTAFMEGLAPPWAWRVGLSVIGLLLYAGTIRLALDALEPFLGAEPDDRMARGRALCLPPYLWVGGVLMTGVALLNYETPWLALSSAAATLGGTSALAWMYRPRGRRARPAAAAPIAVPASRGWQLLGMVAVLFALAYGRGFQF